MAGDGALSVAQINEIGAAVRNAMHKELLPIARRIEAVEAKAARIDAVESRVEGFAAALTACAQASASAANAALDVKQSFATHKDDTEKLVASALQIHKASIAATVDAAIASAVKPLMLDVESLKKNDGAQNGAMVVVARALGVEKQLDKDLVAGSPQEAGASSGTLKHSRIVQSVIALGLLAKIIVDFLAPHH